MSYNMMCESRWSQDWQIFLTDTNILINLSNKYKVAAPGVQCMIEWTIEGSLKTPLTKFQVFNSFDITVLNLVIAFWVCFV